MPTAALRKRRERTNVGRRNAQQEFNAPGGLYKPTFGKTTVLVSGHGQPGYAPQPATVANYNPSTPGNIAGYNPDVPGNVANYNPDIPGNYVSTNPDIQGNIAYYNPGYGGNIAGYNPTKPGNTAYNPPVPGQIVYTTVNGPSAPAPSTYTSGYFSIEPGGAYNPTNSWYAVWEVERPAGFYVSGNKYTNASTGGNANYNAYYPGNAVYNASTPGTANYNPPVKGTANYNPGTPSTANYNPVTPGNANYNTRVEGQAGTPFTALGVAFPGGAVGSASPTVGQTMVVVPYTAEGIWLGIAPGGTVVVEEI